MTEKTNERPQTLTEEFSKAKDEKTLIKKIAEHEAYSAAYKLKLAGIVMTKAAKLAAKGAVVAGKTAAKVGVQLAKGASEASKKMQMKREAKRKDW